MADPHTFIGNGKGLSRSTEDITDGGEGDANVRGDDGGGTRTAEYTIAQINQTGTDAGIWLLFDFDGDGNFNAAGARGGDGSPRRAPAEPAGAKPRPTDVVERPAE